jgi:hypothetical protein
LNIIGALIDNFDVAVGLLVLVDISVKCSGVGTLKMDLVSRNEGENELSNDLRIPVGVFS